MDGGAKRTRTYSQRVFATCTGTLAYAEVREKSEPIVQHNPQPHTLNPLIVVNQTLPIAVVILHISLDRPPQRKAITKLHRRTIIRAQIVHKLHGNGFVL